MTTARCTPSGPVVAATTATSAAHAATAIAEGFRAEGKHVLLLMDSVTRFARALREIGLASGEPPVRRGFPPSVFAELPRLFERAGCNARGEITGIYTVLLEEEEDDLAAELELDLLLETTSFATFVLLFDPFVEAVCTLVAAGRTVSAETGCVPSFPLPTMTMIP